MGSELTPEEASGILFENLIGQCAELLRLEQVARVNGSGRDKAVPQDSRFDRFDSDPRLQL